MARSTLEQTISRLSVAATLQDWVPTLTARTTLGISTGALKGVGLAEDAHLGKSQRPFLERCDIVSQKISFFLSVVPAIGETCAREMVHTKGNGRW